MKRPIVLIIHIICFSIQYLMADNPVIQFMSNGDRIVHNTYQIDSITFSHYDLDSIWNPEIVTHVIWTCGIPNRTLISENDSVVLHRPPTILKPGVREIKYDLSRHIINVTDLFNLTLSRNCPSNLVPRKGERLYTLEMNNLFPCGFMGEVKNVRNGDENIEIECEPVDYEDIFESYYGYFQEYIYNKDSIDNDSLSSNQSILLKQTPCKSGENEYIHSLPRLNYHFPMDFITPCPILGFEAVISNDISVGIIPTVKATNNILVEPDGQKTNSSTLDVELELNLKQSINGSASKEIKQELFNPTIPIPVAPMINFFAEIGAILNIVAENVNASSDVTRIVKLHASSHHSGVSLSQPQFAYSITEHPVHKDNIYISGNSTIDIGAYVELGVETAAESWRKKFDKNEIVGITLGKLSAGFSGGLRLNANAFYTEVDWNDSEKNSNLYEALSKPDNITAGLFGEFGIEASFLSFSKEQTYPIDIKPFFQSSILPSFEGIELDTSDNDILRVESPYKSGLLTTTLGFCAFDITDDINSMNVAQTAYAGTSHKESGIANGGLGNPVKGKSYRIQPYMQYLQKKILAGPSVNYHSREMTPPTVTIKDCYLLNDHDNNMAYNPIIELDIQFNDLTDNLFSYFTISGEIDGEKHYLDTSNGEIMRIEDVKISVISLRDDIYRSMIRNNDTYTFQVPIKLTFHGYTKYPHYLTINAPISFNPRHSLTDISVESTKHYTNGNTYKITATSSVTGFMAYYFAEPDIYVDDLTKTMGKSVSLSNYKSIITDGISRKTIDYEIFKNLNTEKREFFKRIDLDGTWWDIYKYTASDYVYVIFDNNDKNNYKDKYIVELPKFQIYKINMCQYSSMLFGIGNEELSDINDIAIESIEAVTSR